MKTPNRILATRSLIFFAYSTIPVLVAFAQDPFSPDEFGDVAKENATTSEMKDDQSEVDRPDAKERSALVLSFRSNPPRTAAELARAIQLMARIRRWDEVGRWMDEVAKLGLTETTASQMVQVAGAQTFVQLVGLESGLSDLRKSNARKILALASDAANNPKKLNESVAKLRSPSKSERIQGYQSLESAGNRGIAALINHHLAEGAAAPTATMCEAFSLLGKSSFAAWQAAMTTSNAESRGKLALLGSLSGEASLTTELCVAANDPRIDQEVRDVLAKIAATKNKTIPSSKRVFRHAIEQMEKSLSAFQKLRWMDEPDAYIRWELAEDGRTILEKPARLADLDWTRAAQHANSAIHCGASTDSQSGLAMAVLCEDACRTNPQAAYTLSIADVAPKFSASIADSYEFGCLIWDAAEKQGLASAQLVAIRNLGRWANSETIPNAVRERLSMACESGVGPVRYTSAQALLGSMYTRAEGGSLQLLDVHFDGRNRLERVLAEMRMLEGKPLALVIGGAVDLRTHTRTLLESFGYRVAESSSASQTMSLLRVGQPIETIFVVSRVLEMNLGELTQRVRANPSTATCPIAILAESLSRGEHEIMGSDVRVVLGSVPPTQSEFADILRRMQVVTQSLDIDAANRTTWRELSASYWEERQNKFVSTQAKAASAMAVDTPLGQLRLIQILTDNSVSMPRREQASQNFVQSLKQFGVLISSETVKAQYDEYNKRGPDDSELRIVLGRILDAIEAAKGDRPWAEVAP